MAKLSPLGLGNAALEEVSALLKHLDPAMHGQDLEPRVTSEFLYGFRLLAMSVLPLVATAASLRRRLSRAKMFAYLTG